MSDKNIKIKKIGLLLGDSGTIIIIVLLGGLFHKTITYNYSSIFITSISWIIGWISLASISRLYNHEYVIKIESVWFSVWVMILASPIAGLIRGVILEKPIIPVFVGVLGGVLAISMFFWRLLYMNLNKGKSLE